MKILALTNLDGERVPRAALQMVARAAGVTAVVFAGDVLPPGDAPADADDRNRRDGADPYAAFFDALAAPGVPVAIIPGEHDRAADLLQQGTAHANRMRSFAVVDRAVVSLTPDLLVGGLGGLLWENWDGTGAAPARVPPEA